MKRIVWIASYPKSGNTWVRFFLANYLRNDATGGIPVDQLAFGRIASLRALFDEWSGIESSDLTEEEIASCRGDVFRSIAGASMPRIYFKIHDAWTLGRKGDPLFPPDVSSAVIYVVRNPLDVAVSMAYHWDISPMRAVALMCDDGFVLNRSVHHITTQLPQKVSSWSEHVRSWTEESGMPVTVVRYEDLSRDAAGTFSRMLDALGEPVDSVRVAEAVQHTSFDRLKAQEEERGFPERHSRVSPFFRGGRIGDGQQVLTQEEIDKLIAAHAAMMRRVGYLHESDQLTPALQQE